MATRSKRLFPLPERRDVRKTTTAWALRGCGVLLLGGSALAQSLVNGGVVSGTISAPGETHTYTFEARRGNHFEMRLVDVNASGFVPQLELYAPWGALLETSSSEDVAVIEAIRVTRATEGTYTVVVSDGREAPGDAGAYDLHFVLAPGANEGGELVDGLTVFGEIERGDIDSFTFRVAAGQSVQGTYTTLYGGTLVKRFELFTANGSGSGTGGSTFEFSTTGGGLHTIVISDASSTATGTGRYSIVVHGLSAAPPYPPSVFLRSEYGSDPLLFDNAGNPGLGPRIGDPGEPFNFSIDCTGAASPSIYLLWLSTGQQSAASTPWGWLYLEGPRLLRKVGRHTRSVEAWYTEPTGLPLPNDPSLVGTTYTVQGACGGRYYEGTAVETRLRLSGAITQTIGAN